MDNKDLLNAESERSDVLTENNEHPLPIYEVPEPPLTALEFEIAENEPTVFEQPDDIAPVTVEPVEEEQELVLHTDVEEAFAEVKERDPHEDEFLIPDSYTEGFDTPANMRPTYLPRFTEVSDTYRMQNDPRPRVDSEKTTKVVEKTEFNDASELDPTSEGLENMEVEKVVLTSAAPISKDLTDETLKVLKFSTPVEHEIQDALTISAESDNSESAAEVFDGVDSEKSEQQENLGAEENSEEETPKNLTVPDPDVSYSVVDFSKEQETFESDKPLGSETVQTSKHHKGEFTSPVQRDSIKDRMLDTLMSIRVRLVCVALLFVTVVMFDCIRFFGNDPLTSAGIPYASFATACSVCMFLLAIPEVIGACRMLIKKTLSPEIFPLVALPIVIVNGVVLSVNLAESYISFAVLYGLLCFAVILAGYIKTDADFMAFKSVSKNIGKNVLEKRFTRELPRENLALDGAVDEYNSKTARMFRTAFVSGFFRRSSVSCENSYNVAMMLGVGAGVSLVTALVSFFLNGYSVVCAVQSFTLVFLLALPAFSIFLHKLPYRQSMCEVLEKDEGVFIGESSIYESADVDVVTYEDTEIFGTEDVRIKKVHLYGKAYNTPKAMKQMYSLFTVVGGPLDYVFSSSLDRKCAAATDIVIESDGISGMMEGHRVYAGTEEYMIRHGVSIPSDDYRTNTSTTDSTRIMYGAEDNEVYVKFFIRYSFSEEFSMMIPELKEKKIVPLIYTRDPNITGDFIKMLTLGEDIIRVMKKFVPRTDEEQIYRQIDSGLVTYGDKTNAINMVLLAKKYTALQSVFAISELIAMISGSVLAVVVALGGFFNLPETLIALWPVVWCVVLKLRSNLTLGASRNIYVQTEEEENI